MHVCKTSCEGSVYTFRPTGIKDYTGTPKGMVHNISVRDPQPRLGCRYCPVVISPSLFPVRSDQICQKYMVPRTRYFRNIWSLGPGISEIFGLPRQYFVLSIYQHWARKGLQSTLQRATDMLNRTLVVSREAGRG